MKTFLLIMIGFFLGTGVMLGLAEWAKSSYPYSSPQEGTVKINYIGEGKTITIYEDNRADLLKVAEEHSLPAPPNDDHMLIQRDDNRADKHIISYTYGSN